MRSKKLKTRVKIPSKQFNFCFASFSAFLFFQVQRQMMGACEVFAFSRYLSAHMGFLFQGGSK